VSLKVRRGHLVWPSPCLAPFHEQAGGQPPKHAENPDTLAALNAATIIVVGDVQTLMRSAFDSPTGSIKLEPLRGVESLRRGAGDQSHLLVFASSGPAQQPRRLAGYGKTDVLGRQGSGLDAAVFGAALFFSEVRAWVAVGFSRGKMRRRSGYFLFDVGPQGGLIILDCQQVIGSALQDQRASRLILGMQGVQAEQASCQV
jgi:hypothetical protein